MTGSVDVRGPFLISLPIYIITQLELFTGTNPLALDTPDFHVYLFFIFSEARKNQDVQTYGNIINT